MTDCLKFDFILIPILIYKVPLLFNRLTGLEWRQEKPPIRVSEGRSQQRRFFKMRR